MYIGIVQRPCIFCSGMASTFYNSVSSSEPQGNYIKHLFCLKEIMHDMNKKTQKYIPGNKSKISVFFYKEEKLIPKLNLYFCLWNYLWQCGLTVPFSFLYLTISNNLCNDFTRCLITFFLDLSDMRLIL